MFLNEARELLMYMRIITDFGDELKLEDGGGGCWSVIRESGAGTMVYVGETEGISMMFYELNGWTDGDDPVWTRLAEAEEEVE